MAEPLKFHPTTGEKGVPVYRIKGEWGGEYLKEGGKGMWYPSEPFPNGYTLVSPVYPTMKFPQDPFGVVTDMLKNPKTLILVAGALGLFFFRKPLLKNVKKVGRKVGIK